MLLFQTAPRSRLSTGRLYLTARRYRPTFPFVPPNSYNTSLVNKGFQFMLIELREGNVVCVRRSRENDRTDISPYRGKKEGGGSDSILAISTRSECKEKPKIAS